MICVSSKHIRDGDFQDFKINTWWREKALRTEKNNGKLRIGRGGGNFKAQEKPESKCHSEKQNLNTMDGGRGGANRAAHAQ